jgi:hypothetical protein
MSLLCLPDGLTCNKKQPIMIILLGMALTRKSIQPQPQLNCLFIGIMFACLLGIIPPHHDGIVIGFSRSDA